MTAPEAIREALACGNPGCECQRPIGNTHCPHHDDHKPSLSLKADGLRVLFHCHAGCSQDAVMEALRERGVWPKRSEREPGARPATYKGEPIFTWYDYRRDDGSLAYIVGRTPSKQFPVFHPDGTYGWKPGYGLGRRLLYRLPELMSAEPAKVVLLVEGEKDVEMVRSHGFVATSTPGGAGNGHRCDLAPLAGRHVVIIPDRDTAGHKHAGHLASLLCGDAASLRRLELPGNRKDLTEWFEAGGTADELQKLLHAAQPWEASIASGAGVEKQGDFGAVVVQLSDVQREEVRWRWPLRLPFGKLTIIEGDPGTGKSYLTMAIATAVTRGDPLPGDCERYEPQRVLVLSAEDGLADTIRPRLEDMGADLNFVLALTAVRDAYGRERFPTLADDLLSIESVLARGGYGVVVIDPINAYLRGVDGHKDTDIRSVLGPLAHLAERYGVAVICVRHLTKGGRDKSIYRGLGGIGYTAAARSVLLVGINPDNTTERVIVCHKHNLAPDSPAITFEIAAGRFLWKGESRVTAAQLLAPEQGGEERLARDEAIDFLREALADGRRPAKEVETAARELGISARTLRRARRSLGVLASHTGEAGQRGAGAWWWELPRQADNGVAEIKAANMANSEKLATLIPPESENGLKPEGVGRLNPSETAGPMACSDCGALIPGTSTLCAACGAERGRLVAYALELGARQLCWNCGEAQGESEDCQGCRSAHGVDERQGVLLMDEA
jgi:putative DNA primase/helicase